MSDADLHRILTLADFEAPARLAMDPAAFRLRRRRGVGRALAAGQRRSVAPLPVAPARAGRRRDRRPIDDDARHAGRAHRPPDPWALATGGEAGVSRALAILREELEITMALLGTPSHTAITRAHVGPPTPVPSDT
jgi:hypothetical protein